MGTETWREYNHLERSMNKRPEKKETFYNEAYKVRVEYSKLPSEVIYYPLWKYVISKISAGDMVADFGCGTGQLAKLMFDGRINYVLGIDFSEVAITKAKKLNPTHEEVFVKGDLYDKSVYLLKNYNVAIFCEVLEHLERDCEILNNLSLNVKLLITLPSYDSLGHVRYFKNIEEVIERYKNFINIKEINVFPIHKQICYILEGKREF